jgi:uncharacterized membrane protein YfcA
LSEKVEAVANFLIIAVVGVLAGLLAGFLGIGGGTVMVPVMVGLGLSGVQAVGTSTLAIVIIALAGSVQNWRMGYLNLKNVALLGLPALVTAYVGTKLASIFPEYILLGAFGLFMLFNIYLIGLKKKVVSEAKRQAEQVNGEVGANASKPTPERATMHPALARGIIGGTAGFLAGLFGVGGGVVMVPLQILLLGENIKSAIQTSLGAIVITALSACTWHTLNNNVQFATGAILGVGGLVGVQVSTRFLPKLSDRLVTFMFRALLALLSIFFFYKAWQSYG